MWHLNNVARLWCYQPSPEPSVVKGKEVLKMKKINHTLSDENLLESPSQDDLQESGGLETTPPPIENNLPLQGLNKTMKESKNMTLAEVKTEPSSLIPTEPWNSERLNEHLAYVEKLQKNQYRYRIGDLTLKLGLLGLPALMCCFNLLVPFSGMSSEAVQWVNGSLSNVLNLNYLLTAIVLFYFKFHKEKD
jgi:hypothetical protein